MYIVHNKISLNTAYSCCYTILMNILQFIKINRTALDKLHFIVGMNIIYNYDNLINKSVVLYNI